ncbi:MAG TPA: NADH-quinone oxidoreductase subunit N [Fimbriimonadaceae bacterium]|nr:NADH-quinone oxidoreductase subunit N [Fimbriimonadaceae bacterium]
MFQYAPPSIEWLTILPILTVVVTGVIALLIELLRPKGANGVAVAVSLIGLVVAAGFTVIGFARPEAETFAGMAIRDGFGSSIELIVIVVTALAVLFSDSYLREKGIAFGEFYPLALWSASGAMMMATTRNLLMVFIGLEVLSVSLYVLAGLSRSEEKSEEAAIKYFLLGAFASGFFLYGLAFFYGATGTTHLSGFADAIQADYSPTKGLLIAGLGLMLVGFSFKSGFVPFHQWTPDVYQGAPTNVTAFMAGIAKLGALAALWRVLEVYTGWQTTWMPAMIWVAILTMSVGNLAALVQKDVKRILGYSSISHAGYMLVAVLAHAKSPQTVSDFSLLYYLFGYSLMTIGAFAIVSLTARSGKEGTRLEDLRGLAYRSPFVATCLVIFMFSLIGLPPTVGFVGKLLIFNAAVQANLMPLAIVLAVNSAVSAFYYLGIVWAVMGKEQGEPKPWTIELGPRVACVLCAFGVLAAAIFVGPVQGWLSEQHRATQATPVLVSRG